MSTIVTESSDVILDLISYQGFNPIDMIKKLKTIEKNPDVLSQEIKVLCLISVNRGVKISKMIQKMKPEGARIVNALCTKYGVRDSRPREPGDVTLSRISACFPGMCAEHMSKGRGRVIGVKPSSLPSYLCFPAGGSLIPTDEYDLIQAWKEWRASFSQIISSEEKSIDYDSIVINSPLYSNEERRDFLRSLGFVFNSDMLIDSSTDIFSKPRSATKSSKPK